MEVGEGGEETTVSTVVKKTSTTKVVSSTEGDYTRFVVVAHHFIPFYFFCFFSVSLELLLPSPELSPSFTEQASSFVSCTGHVLVSTALK